MKKIYLHTGLPKCASTSFQSAAINNATLTYPKHGLCLHEHIAIPLKLKGIDAWTAKWFSEEWVNAEYDRIIRAVRESNQTVILSSERLFNITEVQINILRTAFEFDLEVLLFHRSFGPWVNSMWRHAVFHEDLSITYQEFAKGYDLSVLTSVIDELRKYVKVHTFDIDRESFTKDLADLLGTDIELERHNVGANQDCCDFLQKIHCAVGSKEFKQYFTIDQKLRFSKMFKHASPGVLDVFDVPI